MSVATGVQFSVFSKAVHARWQEMSKHELYVTDIGDEIFDKYLASFPAGSNPMFRKRTEHDCSTCRRFVRHLGRMVGIDGGTVVTVWGGLDLPHPFREVAEALDSVVRAAKIVSVFRTKEKLFGADHNYDNVTKERWDHFWGAVAERHWSATPEKHRGEKDAAFQVMNRGLTEIPISVTDTVLDLIAENSLYRGEQYKAALTGFRELQVAFKKHGEVGHSRDDLFVWENLDHKFGRIRNDVIGTLLVDLAEEKMEPEAAVKAFEKKVAPENYMRPKPVITQRQVEAAVQQLTSLGLLGAMQRRYARFSDVSVADVLWVDNATQSKMKDGITALLEAHVQKAAPDLKHAVKMSADVFLRDVLPEARSLEVFVENRHQGNFVSLTGADGPERMFKWGNNFAWSYDGDLADSDIRRQVQAMGGRVDGVLRFSHQWNYDKRNASLMDLHVFMPGNEEHEDGCHDHYPSGQRVGWNRRTDFISGGVQDVDYVNPAPEGYVPVENITFPSMAKLKEGRYVFKIHNWQLRHPTYGGVRAEIECGGQVYSYEIDRPMKHKEWVTVATATLKDGVFTIEHRLKSATASQDKWGIKTESLVPVTSVMFSPNHWGDNEVGARHLIFALDGCKNPGSCRGIYNEFLKPDLVQHRRVFEVLGAKTKCPPADEQISGVGFTQARNDSVTVVVDGRRAYTLTF